MKYAYQKLTNCRILHIIKDSSFFEEHARTENAEPFSCGIPSDWACKNMPGNCGKGVILRCRP